MSVEHEERKRRRRGMHARSLSMHENKKRKERESARERQKTSASKAKEREKNEQTHKKNVVEEEKKTSLLVASRERERVERHREAIESSSLPVCRQRIPSCLSSLYLLRRDRLRDTERDEESAEEKGVASLYFSIESHQQNVVKRFFSSSFAFPLSLSPSLSLYVSTAVHAVEDAISIHVNCRHRGGKNATK